MDCARAARFDAGAVRGARGGEWLPAVGLAGFEPRGASGCVRAHRGLFRRAGAGRRAGMAAASGDAERVDGSRGAGIDGAAGVWPVVDGAGGPEMKLSPSAAMSQHELEVTTVCSRRREEAE